MNVHHFVGLTRALSVIMPYAAVCFYYGGIHWPTTLFVFIASAFLYRWAYNRSVYEEMFPPRLP